MDLSWNNSGRRGAFSVAAAAVLLLIIGVTVTVIGFSRSTSLSPGQSTAMPAPSAKADGQPRKPTKEPSGTVSRDRPADQPDFGSVLPGSTPVALTIPSIDVRADTIVDLGLANDGTIEVPKDGANPGWFAPGPSPGQFGPAVIAGHVDSKSGPAVFYRLAELGRGDRVKVTRQDGSVATFAVDRVQTFEKDTFPTRAVYGNTTNRAELRLITCSGLYDEETGYRSNTVAFAHLV